MCGSNLDETVFNWRNYVGNTYVGDYYHHRRNLSRSETIRKKCCCLCCRVVYITRNFFNSQNPRLINQSGFKLRAGYNLARTIYNNYGHVVRDLFVKILLVISKMSWIKKARKKNWPCAGPRKPDSFQNHVFKV